MSDARNLASNARTASLAAVMALLGSAWFTPAAAAGVEDEVRATFERFVAAQNAHDPKALEPLLADSPSFLWITRGTTIWGRDAALKRFVTLYEGTWKLEPDYASLRVIPVADGAAHLVALVNFTTGAAGQPGQVTTTYLNQILVKSGGSWRVTSILPIPGPAK